MSYQIVKGWPAESAIDEVIVANSGVTLKDGMFATQYAANTGSADGSYKLANYNSAAVTATGNSATDADAAATPCMFVMDYDVIRGASTVGVVPTNSYGVPQPSKFLGIKGPIVLKLDQLDNLGNTSSTALHFDTSKTTYYPGAPLSLGGGGTGSATAGLLQPATGSQRIVGHVLSYDSTNKVLRCTFNG